MSDIWHENNEIPKNAENGIKIEVEDITGKIGNFITTKNGFTKNKIISIGWLLVKKWRFLDDEEDVIQFNNSIKETVPTNLIKDKINV